MIGLDTNVLLRWLLNDDSDPAQTQLAAETIASELEPVWVGPIVLAELSWVMRRNFGLKRQDLVEVFQRLLDSPMFIIPDRTCVEEAVTNFSKGGPGFSDHLIAALNSSVGCRTTYTFDKIAAKTPHFTTLT